MGTSKPLVIYVDQCYENMPWVITLAQKGHEIHLLDPKGADLILSPTCARFVEGMEQFLESFLAGARKVRYPTKGGQDD